MGHFVPWLFLICFFTLSRPDMTFTVDFIWENIPYGSFCPLIVFDFFFHTESPWYDLHALTYLGKTSLWVVLSLDCFWFFWHTESPWYDLHCWLHLRNIIYGSFYPLIAFVFLFILSRPDMTFTGDLTGEYIPVSVLSIDCFWFVFLHTELPWYDRCGLLSVINQVSIYLSRCRASMLTYSYSSQRSSTYK